MRPPGAQADFDAPPAATDRLFLALFPDDATATRIAALAATECARHGLRSLPFRADRLHLTLFHLGDWAGMPADVVEAVGQAAGSLREAAFELAFDIVASLPTPRQQKPFVLKSSSGNEALRAFHARLGAALQGNGLGRWTRDEFEPHVTLAYDRVLVPAQAVEPVAWTARGFVLVRSLLGQARHVPLARWTLAA